MIDIHSAGVGADGCVRGASDTLHSALGSRRPRSVDGVCGRARARADAALGGRKTVGVKVGYANKAMWRVLKLDTLVWAHMYDDTVRYANANVATLSLAHRSRRRSSRRSSSR